MSYGPGHGVGQFVHMRARARVCLSRVSSLCLLLLLLVLILVLILLLLLLFSCDYLIAKDLFTLNFWGAFVLESESVDS